MYFDRWLIQRVQLARKSKKTMLTKSEFQFVLNKSSNNVQFKYFSSLIKFSSIMRVLSRVKVTFEKCSTWLYYS